MEMNTDKHFSFPDLITVLLFLSIGGLLTAQAPQSLEWARTGGPLGGLGYDVRIHPDQPDVLFVTDQFAGVFKSIDGGLNWVPKNNGIKTVGPANIPVFCLTIDPHNPDIVWAGLSGERGMYRSTDGGESWVEKTNGIVEFEGISFRGITIDPRSSDIVYIAAEIASFVWGEGQRTGREFDMTKGVVYKTTDAGENWEAVWRGDNLARYIWINPENPDIIYVSTGIFDREAANSDDQSNTAGGVGIIKSVDGGETWQQMNQGLTNLYIGTLYMHPNNPDILLAGAANNAYPEGDGVFLTTDGAATWRQVLDIGAQSVEFAEMNPEIAYAGNPVAVYQSLDGGENWEKVSIGENIWGPPGVQAGFPIDFQVDPRDPGRFFANNYGGGNFLSNDGGRTWQVASKGYTGAQVRKIAVSPADPMRIYAAARSGVYLTLDGGENWEGRNVSPSNGLEWNAIAVDPHNDLHILAANHWIGRIFQSYDGTDTWSITASQLPLGGWRTIEYTPDPAMVYAGTGAFISAGQYDNSLDASGIYVSRDGGESWQPANDVSSQTAQVADLACHPENPMIVYAATTNKGFLRTLDGGASWSSHNSGLPGMPTEPSILSVAIDPLNPEHLFAGLESAGLYSSINGGMTWDVVAIGLNPEAKITSIVYNPADPQMLFIADFHSSVFQSIDAGETWEKISDGLQNRAVNTLSVSQDGTQLYAGTEGEGVFRLKLSEATTGSGNPLLIGKFPVRIFPNPFRSQTIINYRVARPADISVQILDVHGREIAVLKDGLHDAGSHTVRWDGTDESGIRLSSGIYLCRLSSEGDQVISRILMVR
jgi:photosystem II stability/assembly factor-like uncharacterized protein